MTYYKETTIRPAHSGFGMYQTGEFNGDRYADLSDLIGEAISNVGEVFELGVDELPDGVEDIRGQIYNQPKYVFAYMDCGEVAYFGVDTFEEEE